MRSSHNAMCNDFNDPFAMSTVRKTWLKRHSSATPASSEDLTAAWLLMKVQFSPSLGKAAPVELLPARQLLKAAALA